MTENKTVQCSPSSFRYAKALMELGVDIEDLKSLSQTFSQTPELYRVLENPSVERSVKTTILKKIFKMDQLINFLSVLIDKKQIRAIEEIFAAYNQLVMKDEKVLPAKLYYVVSPSKSQLDDMEKLICKNHHCNNVNWEMIKAPELVGGFLLDVNSTEYDYSIKGHLKRLEDDLTRR